MRYLAPSTLFQYTTDTFHQLLAERRLTIIRLLELGRTPVVTPEIIRVFSRDTLSKPLTLFSNILLMKMFPARVDTVSLRDDLSRGNAIAYESQLQRLNITY